MDMETKQSILALVAGGKDILTPLPNSPPTVYSLTSALRGALEAISLLSASLPVDDEKARPDEDMGRIELSWSEVVDIRRKALELAASQPVEPARNLEALARGTSGAVLERARQYEAFLLGQDRGAETTNAKPLDPAKVAEAVASQMIKRGWVLGAKAAPELTDVLRIVLEGGAA